MYYIILKNKEQQEYYRCRADAVGINNALHFKEFEYEREKRYVYQNGWVFIKILNDGTKVILTTW